MPFKPAARALPTARRPDTIAKRMTEVRTRLLNSVSLAFARMDRALAVEATAAVGPFGMRLLFASRSIADSYLQVLLPRRSDEIDFSIAVLGSSDIDLSALVPDPPDCGRSFAGVGYSAVWHADRLPVLYVFDQQRRQGLVWFAKAAAPATELSRPLGPLLQSAMLDRPWTVIHAAAVGRLGRFALLAGKGRSGKTTAALACARAGWSYAGDDYVLVNSATAELEPLYSSARLRSDMGPAFADILTASREVSRDGEDRHELNLSIAFGPERIRGGRLAAILLPRRQGAEVPEFAFARPSDAFHALLLSTSMGASAPLRILVEKLSQLVSLAPVSFVDTGRHPDRIPAALAGFMDRL